MSPIQVVQEAESKQSMPAELRLSFLPAAASHNRVPCLGYEEDAVLCTEVLCYREVGNVSELCALAEKEGASSKDQEVLWGEQLSMRQVGLYTLLCWCHVLGFLGLGYHTISHFCGGVDMCYVFLLPGLFWGGMVVIGVCILKACASSFLHKKLCMVENGLAFMLVQRAQGTFFTLDTKQKAKEYQPSTEHTITLLHCKWKPMLGSSSYIKMAFFSLPPNECIHIPIACDAIDTLRGAYTSLPPHLLFQNYHGMLVVQKQQPCTKYQEEHFINFLLRSGFSIACRAQDLIIAMRRMGGSGQWVTQEVAVHEDTILLRLVFVPCENL